MSSKTKKEPKVQPKKPAAKPAQTKPRETQAIPAKAPEVQKPRGPAPVALVSSRHEGAMIERQARGFSMGELGSAGFSIHDAGRLGLSMDIRRRTVLEKNVESLKGWFNPPKAAPKPEPIAPKAVAEPEQKPKKRAPAKKTK